MRGVPRHAVTLAIGALVLARVAGAAWLALAEPRCFEGARVRSEHGTEGAPMDAVYVASYFRFHRSWSREIERLFDRIPRDAAVSAQYPFLLAFAGRSELTLFPDVRGASWVVLSAEFPRVPSLSDGELARTLARLRRRGFRRAGRWGGVLLLHREGADEAPDDRCLTDCRRKEAEYLPSGAAHATTAGGTCLARNRFDPAASGNAARASWWGAPIPVRWTDELAPGRYRVRLRAALAPAATAPAYAFRLLARDAERGTVLAERSFPAGDFPANGDYRLVALRFAVAGKAPQRIHLEVEDPGNAGLRLDWLELRGQPPRATQGETNA